MKQRGDTMAFADRTSYYDVGDGSILGSFIEKDHGHFFEFSQNPEPILAPPAHGGRNVEYNHLVWVGDVIGRRTRYARVLKNVVHIITDENEFGWVIEKWSIKHYREYTSLTRRINDMVM